jgi:peroxiredoxin Q/BCP
VVAEGTPAPDFELETDTGETVKLSDLRGKPVVLFFYPKDETRGCTIQACGMRDAYPDFEGKAHVFGISIDDAESHRAFRENSSLPYPLLVDPGSRMADAYGIERLDNPERSTWYKRQTVIVGADGLVAKTMDNVDPETHAADALAAIEA